VFVDREVYTSETSCMDRASVRVGNMWVERL